MHTAISMIHLILCSMIQADFITSSLYILFENIWFLVECSEDGTCMSILNESPMFFDLLPLSKRSNYLPSFLIRTNELKKILSEIATYLSPL